MTERDEDWAHDLWPDDDDGWPEYDPTAMQQLFMGTAPWSGRPPGRRRLLGLITTGAVAMAAGIGGALAVKDLTAGSSTPPTAQSGQPGGSQSGSLPNTGEGGTGEGGTGQGGRLLPGVSGAMVIGGKVTAVGPRSITISAGPQSVTARVTGSTRFSGRVTGLAEVRVGDMVMAQISESNGVNSLVSLQDPVSVS